MTKRFKSEYVGNESGRDVRGGKSVDQAELHF
jgi:hypothetical protein